MSRERAEKASEPAATGMHTTTRTQWPLIAVLWGWRCSCGATEDPRHFSPDLADAAAQRRRCGPAVTPSKRGGAWSPLVVARSKSPKRTETA